MLSSVCDDATQLMWPVAEREDGCSLVALSASEADWLGQRDLSRLIQHCLRQGNLLYCLGSGLMKV